MKSENLVSCIVLGILISIGLFLENHKSNMIHSENNTSYHLELEKVNASDNSVITSEDNLHYQNFTIKTGNNNEIDSFDFSAGFDQVWNDQHTFEENVKGNINVFGDMDSNQTSYELIEKFSTDYSDECILYRIKMEYTNTQKQYSFPAIFCNAKIEDQLNINIDHEIRKIKYYTISPSIFASNSSENIANEKIVDISKSFVIKKILNE